MIGLNLIMVNGRLIKMPWLIELAEDTSIAEIDDFYKQNKHLIKRSEWTK